MTSHITRRRGAAVLLAVSLPLTLAACGGADEESPDTDAGGGETAEGGGDTGAELTMWVRSATDDFSQRLVDEYNATHENQIELTIIPNDNYLQKVGAAAGSNALPDLLAADVVYAPNYTSQGLFVDISDRVEGLDYADDLAPSHLEAGSWEDVLYAVPHKLDSSVMFYNKDLFTAAGLDPEAPPTNFDEVLEYARAINGVEDGVYGFQIGGNCGGCGVYSMFPYAWAAGEDVLSDDGTEAHFDTDAWREIFTLYNTMWEEGLVPDNARTEDGATWQNSFIAGDIGILPHGSPIVGDIMKQAEFEWGVTPLMAPDGSGTSTFVGGDVIGVTRSSDQVDAAWNFLEWTLEEEAQVEIIAQNGDLPGRLDLTDNEYTSEDPRTKLIADGIADGHTPFALPFGELFNNPNGPWLAMVRQAIFDGDIEGAIAEGQEKIQSGLDQAQ